MDCGVEFQDLHAKLVNDTEQVGFGIGTAEEEENLVQVSEREMWLNNTTNDQVDHLLGMNDDASMFYADFPPLPDFPCMSSSSSSSSSSTPLKTIACSTTTTTTSSSSSASSSSAASWAILKSEDGNKMKNHGYDNNMHQNDVSLLDHHHGHANTLSSTASMEISQQQQQQQHENNNIGLSTNDCMDDVIMETFGYMELLEANEFFDPSIFQNEDNPLVDFTQEQQQLQVQPQHQGEYHHEHAMVVNESETKQQGIEEDNNVFVCDVVNNEDEIQGEEESGFDGVNDEMSMVFLEWLKSNKDSVSANDLRNVKLKKSTIESAARRLGGGKEGMKQLLKLILEWVQTSHLQNKRHKQNNTTMLSNVLVPQQQQFQDPCQNQNTFAPESTNTCFNQTQWLIDQTPLIVNPPQFSSQPMVGYVGSDPYTNGSVSNNPYNQQHVTNEFQHMLESNNSWGGSQFTIAAASHYNQSFGENNSNNNNNNMLQHGVSFGGYGNQYPYQFFHGPGDRLMRLGPSATKEARKKRMARQRRFMSHHRNHNNNNNQHLLNNHQGSDPLGRLGGDNCTNLVAAAGSHGNPPNWMYWQTMAAGGGASLAPVVPAEPPPPQVPVERSTMQAQNCHQGRNASSDRRQGWKPEKNLRFLLQKVLKQSDVGSLGRIVLPKKEAETHLPELEARDGISITMEDIGTSRVWNMRYSIRYWPNNKSRMYLLENTGDFVKANGLQEGDFIVIYSDVKCGKFMIRGVKVRQQQGAKPEAKKAGKSHKNQHGNNATNSAGTAVANNGTQSSPKRKNEKILN
ncbi:B3 domain-containing transcription factor ABI3 isoform X1 [Cicer arietinum]|uniref:B3 domain-containing transcription factor ABI3 isoform X2 n=1 Tax=Cicer arietinum TaxID=3827 RepID=A0A3Q7Y756_CICAR|nr:B3 domain-containing transcription factor ABI3 isoform X2 [Cicer arietinum]